MGISSNNDESREVDARDSEAIKTRLEDALERLRYPKAAVSVGKSCIVALSHRFPFPSLRLGERGPQQDPKVGQKIRPTAQTW